MKIKHMEICSKCQICSYITLLNSGLRPQKIAVILKICVCFRGAARTLLGELPLTPDPLAKCLVPSALSIFFLPFHVLPILAVPVLYIKNLKLYPGLGRVPHTTNGPPPSRLPRSSFRLTSPTHSERARCLRK